jgi:hypothetical protein
VVSLSADIPLKGEKCAMEPGLFVTSTCHSVQNVWNVIQHNERDPISMTCVGDKDGVSCALILS